MHDSRGLRIWAWVIAVLGYLLLPVVTIVWILRAHLDDALSATFADGARAVGGIAGGGMVVIPVLAWVITLALHRERRARGERALDGVLLNWVGGILVAGLVVVTFGSPYLPQLDEYLERHGPASVADDVGVTGDGPG